VRIGLRVVDRALDAILLVTGDGLGCVELTKEVVRVRHAAHPHVRRGE
jgi:hypothetical protein